MSDFFIPTEDEGLDADPLLMQMVVAQLLDRGGMRGGRNKSEGVYTYQDPTQIPYDRYNAVNRMLGLMDVPLSAYTHPGVAEAEPFTFNEWIPSSATYTVRNDVTGQILAAALADLEAGEDPAVVAAEAREILAEHPDAGEFDESEWTETFSRAVDGLQKRRAAMAAYDQKYGEGAAERSLAGERIQYEVPVAEGLEPGPLGTEPVAKDWPSIDEWMAAKEQDGDFKAKVWSPYFTDPQKQQADQATALVDYLQRRANLGSGDFKRNPRGESPKGADVVVHSTWRGGLGDTAAASMGGITQAASRQQQQRAAAGGKPAQSPRYSTSGGRMVTTQSQAAKDAYRTILERLVPYYQRQQKPTKAQESLNMRAALLARMLGG